MELAAVGDSVIRPAVELAAVGDSVSRPAVELAAVGEGGGGLWMVTV